MTTLPKNLYYLKMSGSLTDTATQKLVREAVEKSGATFIIFDSLSIGAYKANAKEAVEVLPVLKFLEPLGTVLAIDHVTKPQQGYSDTKPFGSVFKHNMARSQVYVSRPQKDVILLTPKKSNFGELGAPIAIEPIFSENSVRFDVIDSNDTRLEILQDTLPAKEKVFLALQRHPDGTTPSVLANDLSMKPKTVQNHLSNLKKEDRVKSLGNGQWQVTIDKIVLEWGKNWQPDSLVPDQGGGKPEAAVENMMEEQTVAESNQPFPEVPST
jgi:hypothetical protein